MHPERMAMLQARASELAAETSTAVGDDESSCACDEDEHGECERDASRAHAEGSAAPSERSRGVAKGGISSGFGGSIASAKKLVCPRPVIRRMCVHRMPKRVARMQALPIRAESGVETYPSFRLLARVVCPEPLAVGICFHAHTIEDVLSAPRLYFDSGPGSHLNATLFAHTNLSMGLFCMAIPAVVCANGRALSQGMRADLYIYYLVIKNLPNGSICCNCFPSPPRLVPCPCLVVLCV